MSFDQILLGLSPRPFSAQQRGGPGPGRGFDMARELLPRGAASPPDLEKYSPRTSPRAACAWACRPHRPHSCLAGHCYRRSSRRWSRAEAKCILVAAGGRSLSSTSSGPAVRGLPGGVRECMPMAQTTTIRPNRHPEATKPQLPPLRGGRCGLGGLLVVLTAILACGYTLVGSYVDSVPGGIIGHVPWG